MDMPQKGIEAIQGDVSALLPASVKFSRFPYKDKSENTFIIM